MSLDDNYDIAIVGMDGRFPGARSPEEFWQNLRNGVETISFFSDDELEISPDSPVLKNPAFVKAGGVLENIDLFDASFFNIPAAEAEWMIRSSDCSSSARGLRSRMPVITCKHIKD